MAAFAPIRDIPQTGLSEWEAAMLGAMKENIEILIGARVAGTRAVISSSVAVLALGLQSMPQVTANGNFYNISGAIVPTLADYVLLLNNVQALANDVYSTRAAFDTLLQQLKN